MKVKFDGKEYQKRGRNGTALKDLCFSIFKKYLSENPDIEYEGLKNIFNQWHCNNRKVLLDENEWLNQTADGKSRYFEPINHNNIELYFTTQWGNNGGECDNVNKVINFAGEEGYQVEILENDTPNINNVSNTLVNNSNIRIKNIILYGSPGVGKTHNTNKLISLIESGVAEKEIFSRIKNNEQNDGVNINNIKDRVKFITFHQSFGYEDFIEGFRPNEEGNIQLEKGIFLEICKDAEENLLKSGEETRVPFSDAFKTIFKEKIENEESVTVSLKRAGSFFKVTDYNDKTIYFEKQSGNTNHTLSIATLEKMYDAEKNDFINGGLAVYYEPILDKLLEIKRKSVVEQVDRKNYYLVIDEINRGNISKIFGELITLIEEDKRDTLEVTLPYSKMPFKIPSNLYIIGTMNSTDKSIALIDIALRRRFTFLKMEPNLELIDNVKARNIMKQLNEKITDTLGADYVLGHSYFMKIEKDNNDDLGFVMEYKIKPLLEEYFYGDEQGLKSMMEIVKHDGDGDTE